MIPTIGIMIALYIITKMLRLIIDKRKETSIVTLMFAVLTLLMSIYAIISLASSGAEVAQQLLK